MHSKTLVLPHIGDYVFPKNMVFPTAKTLVVYFWNKNGVYYNLNSQHFPNVKHLYFISSSTGTANLYANFYHGGEKIKIYLPWNFVPSGMYGFHTDCERVSKETIAMFLATVPYDFSQEFIRFLEEKRAESQCLQ